MKSKPVNVRIKDVAKQTRYSFATVAKVLAGSAKEARISESAINEIMEVADRLGYVPNIMARNLRSNKSGMIGIYLTLPNDLIAASIMTGILQELPSNGFIPLLTIEDSGYEACYKTWLNNRIEGLLFCGPSINMTQKHFSELQRHNIPFVIAGNPYTSIDYNIVKSNITIVQINNRMGIQLVIDHLIETGRKKIAFIRGPQIHSDSFERESAYIDLIKKHHKPIIADIGGQELFWQRGYLSAKQLLTDFSCIDAIISYDDNVALGAVKYLSDIGKSIPGDIAVTGFDNQPFSEYSIPSLTTVNQPADEIGRISVRLLKKIISQEEIINSHVYIDPSLVIRTSSVQLS